MQVSQAAVLWNADSEAAFAESQPLHDSHLRAFFFDDVCADDAKIAYAVLDVFRYVIVSERKKVERKISARGKQGPNCDLEGQSRRSQQSDRVIGDAPVLLQRQLQLAISGNHSLVELSKVLAEKKRSALVSRRPLQRFLITAHPAFHPSSNTGDRCRAEPGLFDDTGVRHTGCKQASRFPPPREFLNFSRSQKIAEKTLRFAHRSEAQDRRI